MYASKPLETDTLVTMGEPSEASVTLYGGVPPCILMCQGWHVSKGPVRLDVIVKSGAMGSATTHPAVIVSIAKRVDSLATSNGKGIAFIERTCDREETGGNAAKASR